MNCVPIDMLPIQSVHCSLLPEPLKSVEVYFTSEHSFMVCAAQRLRAQTSVKYLLYIQFYLTYRTLICTLNGIHSLRTGIMVEYPVMSTSQGTYVWIEQISEAVRVTYKMRRAGGARTGIENRWFTHSMSSPGHAYQVVHKNQSAFEVVGAFFIIRALASRLPPPLNAPATKHVCVKWRQKSFSTL